MTSMSRALEQGTSTCRLCQVKLTADWDPASLLQSYAAMNYGGFTDPETDALLAALCAAEAGERPPP